MDIRRSQSKDSFLSKKLILAIVAAVIVILVALFAFRFFNVGTGINRGGYQLVNLSTGERYIGKLSGLSGEYVTLDDVYYQQTADTQSSESESTQLEAQGQITVAKLSSSVAKPENKMQIARDKIVHWENLQEDSKIVQAIRGGGN